MVIGHLGPNRYSHREGGMRAPLLAHSRLPGASTRQIGPYKRAHVTSRQLAGFTTLKRNEKYEQKHFRSMKASIFETFKWGVKIRFNLRPCVGK